MGESGNMKFLLACLVCASVALAVPEGRRLPSLGDTADQGELVTCTGWGKPSDSAGGIAPKLRMVSDLPVISNAECDSVYGIVGDGVVCIDTTGGKGTCNGDSGGPLNMKAEVKA